jgi:DNA-binding beta-propeller fold protein YncE
MPGAPKSQEGQGDGKESWVTGRRNASGIALALVLVLIAAAALAQGAGAATQYVFVKQFPGLGSNPSQFEYGAVRPQGLAVSDHNGHIYVADSGLGVVFDFASADDKVADRWEGTNTPAGSFGGHLSVAVDNTSGDVYVADTNHAVVLKFDENGNLIESFGDSLPTPDGQLSGAQTPAGSFVPPSGFYGSFGIAVDQTTHDLYVVDAGHEAIDVFDQEGGYLRQIIAKPEGIYSSGGTEMSGITVSSQTGNVFVTDAGSGLVFMFDAAGNYVSTWNGRDLPNGPDSTIPSTDTGPPRGIEEHEPLPLAAVDSKQRVVVSNGNFYTTLNTFDEAGNFVPPQLNVSGDTVLVAAIAIDQSTEYLYVAGYQKITVYEPRRVPDVAIGPTSQVKPKSVLLSGQVTPDGGDVVDCHFEYIAEGRFRKNSEENRWKDAEQLPCQTDPPSSPPYSATTHVTAEASGLSPGRLYRLRLVASSASGKNIDLGQTFRTPGEYEYSTGLGASGSGAGQLDGPSDVAVDSVTGDVYVADTGNHRVVKFNAAGGFVAAWGWGVGNGASENQVCTSGCQAGIPGGAPGQLTTPMWVEVDNSSGPSAHSVYVADADDRTVLKFTPAGSLVTSWGEGGSMSFAKDGPLGGITVSSGGALFVLNLNTPYPWTEIGQDGGFRSKTAPFQGSSNVTAIDVDEYETWYEARPEEGVAATHRGGGTEPYSFYPAGYGGYLLLPTTGVAVNRVSGEVYVSQKDHIDDFRRQSECISNGVAVCEPTDTFGYGDLVEARGVAFDSSTKRVLTADRGADRIVVFSPVPKPSVTTGSATLDGTAALLSGSVAPASGDSVTSCRFQYGTTLEYELGDVPCSPGAPFSTSTDVTATLSELDPYQNYHYRIVAESPSELPVYGQDRTITPEGDPPIAQGGEAIEIGRTGATLTGLVNPNLGPTLYHFEYGRTSEYGSGTPVAGPIGEDGSDHSVRAAVSDLAPGKTYHFRVVASNFAGIDVGPDRTFNTPDVPSILQAGVSPTSTSTATASVTAVPEFSQTSINLEYGTTGAYGASLVQSLGSDDLAHEVELKVTGLAAGTTYHARVLATNAFGTASSADLTFTTPAATTPKEPKKCHRGFVRRGGKCKKRKKRRHHHGHKHGHRGSGR